MEPLRQHATAIYRLPREKAVVRCGPLESAESLARTVQLVHWLLGHKFPATEPLELEQPVTTASGVLTFWRHYPQPGGTPPARSLGALLRHLHSLPEPPIRLPAYEPLAALSRTVEASALPEPRREWLRHAIDARLSEYRALEFSLGSGLIHGDAYPGNTLWDGDQVRLGDWDEAAWGPHEIDLANTFQGVRFGRTSKELAEFSAAYGAQLAPATLRTLTAMRDLHTLGAFIRRADAGDANAHVQLQHRLDTLQRDELHARWDVH
ncbi:phosphotransferase [Streptomyces sp. 891-h]|uniref:phosphotransferase family protein n=1 Tax=Streptomyces sp. 891-h TaxID=2720714 RepID=UPI001FAA3ABE|nr:phosphotransferase [Streptomyces sp. 891-h]UNZ22286.1 phosphotransferase [Streptomyces sp. 891-h]